VGLTRYDKEFPGTACPLQPAGTAWSGRGVGKKFGHRLPLRFAGQTTSAVEVEDHDVSLCVDHFGFAIR
jgi:hypothetical protein